MIEGSRLRWGQTFYSKGVQRYSHLLGMKRSFVLFFHFNNYNLSIHMGLFSILMVKVEFPKWLQWQLKRVPQYCD